MAKKSSKKSSRSSSSSSTYEITESDPDAEILYNKIKETIEEKKIILDKIRGNCLLHKEKITSITNSIYELNKMIKIFIILKNENKISPEEELIYTRTKNDIKNLSIQLDDENKSHKTIELLKDKTKLEISEYEKLLPYNSNYSFYSSSSRKSYKKSSKK